MWWVWQWRRWFEGSVREQGKITKWIVRVISAKGQCSWEEHLRLGSAIDTND